MSNAQIMKATNLQEKVAQYVNLKVRGKEYDPSTEGCLLQITSTTPFEVSGTECHVQIKDSNAIQYAVKSLHPNISLNSMKGIVLNVYKWGFKSEYDPSTKKLNFQVEIHEVVALSGANTVEIAQNTTQLQSHKLVKKKLDRLKRYYMAQHHNQQNPYDSSIFDKSRKEASDRIRKRADNLAQQIESQGELQDPYLLYKNPGGNMDVSQFSDKSGDQVSMTSALKEKVEQQELLAKQSVPKKVPQTAPTDKLFEFNLDGLSSEPLIHAAASLQQLDNITNKQQGQNIGFMAQQQQSYQTYQAFDYDQEENEDDQSQVDKKKRSAIKSTNQMIPEDVQQENQEEQQSINQQLKEEGQENKNYFGDGIKKRNFNQYASEQHDTDEHPILNQEQKKVKHQWGLDYENQQQQIKDVRQKRREQMNKSKFEGLDNLDLINNTLESSQPAQKSPQRKEEAEQQDFIAQKTPEKSNQVFQSHQNTNQKSDPRVLFSQDKYKNQNYFDEEFEDKNEYKSIDKSNYVSRQPKTSTQKKRGKEQEQQQRDEAQTKKVSSANKQQLVSHESQRRLLDRVEYHHQQQQDFNQSFSFGDFDENENQFSNKYGQKDYPDNKQGQAAIQRGSYVKLEPKRVQPGIASFYGKVNNSSRKEENNHALIGNKVQVPYQYKENNNHQISETYAHKLSAFQLLPGNNTENKFQYDMEPEFPSFKVGRKTQQINGGNNNKLSKANHTKFQFITQQKGGGQTQQRSNKFEFNYNPNLDEHTQYQHQNYQTNNEEDGEEERINYYQQQQQQQDVEISSKPKPNQSQDMTFSQLVNNDDYLNTFADLKAIKNEGQNIQKVNHQIPQSKKKKKYVTNPIKESSQIDLDQFTMINQKKDQNDEFQLLTTSNKPKTQQQFPQQLKQFTSISGQQNQSEKHSSQIQTKPKISSSYTQKLLKLHKYMKSKNDNIQ